MNLKVEFSLADFENKKKRKTILDEIKIKICALLNTNGGRLVLIVTTDNKIHADNIINPIEQWLAQAFVGISKTCKNFTWKQLDYNTIIIEVAGLPILCTLNTNLYLPTESSISMLRGRDGDRILEILKRRVAEIPPQTVREQFDQGRDSGLRESKSVQLKNLSAEKTKSMNLARRIIKQKLTKYVSGFANLSGGHIFYGINDYGIVVGESLGDEKEVEQIKTKVRNAIQKMIWAELGEIECGKQWDIKFVPVKNCDSETLPLTFVIVISVLPCPGGVFAEEPESYHVVDGEVKKIPFDTWKEKVKTWNSGLKRKNEVPMEMKRKTWSSGNSCEKAYMKVTQELVKLGKWQEIKKICKILCEQENQHINTKSVALFHLVTIECCLGEDENAVKHLKELYEWRWRISTNGDEDKSITRLGEINSASAIERFSDNQEVWKIIEKGLQCCVDAPAGLIPAAFYAYAASFLSKLVDNESFMGVSRKDECFEDKVQENVKRVEHFCDLALQYIEHLKDDFGIDKEELKQRINITLASLYLKSESILDHPQVSSSDIDKAAKKISEAENYSLKLKKGCWNFNCCCILLAKSDLCLRQYQLKETDIDNKLKTEFWEHLEYAQKIAEDHGFKEIQARVANIVKNWEKSSKQLNETKIDESKSNEMLVSEWLGSNDE
jgi:hypothetical protein